MYNLPLSLWLALCFFFFFFFFFFSAGSSSSAADTEGVLLSAWYKNSCVITTFIRSTELYKEFRVSTALYIVHVIHNNEYHE